MYVWGIVNKVVLEEESLVDEVLRYVQMIVKGSFDVVIVVRVGLRQVWEMVDVEVVIENWLVMWFIKLEKGMNLKEGLDVFMEKRLLKWRLFKL